MKNPTLSPEFKREAVRLLEQKDTNAAQLARESGEKKKGVKSKIATFLCLRR